MFLGALRAVAASGADVEVVVPESGPLVEYLESAGLRVVTHDFPVLRKALLRPRALVGLAVSTPASLTALVRRVRRSDPDVVYVNTVTLPHWVAAARLARRPVVCHVREAEDQAHRLLQRGLAAPLLACTRIITNSAHTREHLVSHWRSLAGRIDVVHNGFEFDGAPPPREPRPDGELLVVGRLSPRKGQDVALRAVAELHRRGMPVRLRLVGTEFRGYEWYVDDLRRTADELGIAGHVRFDGYRTDVPACNAAADVVLVPSRVEPFGNVAVEALAAARPLVASSVGGLREIVDHGRTGLLVPAGDAGALAEAVATLLEAPAEAAAMGDRGGVDVRRRFALARYEEAVVQVLRTAAREGGRHVRG